jgi:nitrous oxide reductase accessory protein NosL
MTGFAADMDFSKKASGKPELIQTGPQKQWCPVCGMKLGMFYKTSHAMKLSGGKNKQYCSIRCMLEDYEGLQNIVQEILVVDVASEKLIDVRNATYVVGSSAPGTMTMISKYAFANKADAEEFQKKMGGELMTFEQAKASALASMQKDVNMTGMKRQKMMYPKGEKIFKSACDQSIDPLKYNLVNEMKADIAGNKKCGELGEKELQAVTLYLWDVVRKASKADDFIIVQEGEKCPVCGMFVHKYPKWAAKIEYTKEGIQEYAVFDGVKDMMKFYFNPAKWGSYEGIKLLKSSVTDYYTNKAVTAQKAFYVVGSDVYGPMGKELIPFADKASAETFSADHGGKQILTFDEISEGMVYKLDE